MKTISDYAELYMEAAVAPNPAPAPAQKQMPVQISVKQVMAGMGYKDPQLQGALANAIIQYLKDYNVNAQNFSVKTMQFLAQQSGDKDAVAVAMAIEQNQNPNVFVDDPRNDQLVSNPTITQATVDTNGDGQVTPEEQLARDMADAISRSWIHGQQVDGKFNPNAQAVINGIRKILNDFKVTIPDETKLLQQVQNNLRKIPNYNKSPYWSKIDQEITGLLQNAAKPAPVQQ